jgi:isoleucyl-tRNA synthetase
MPQSQSGRKSLSKMYAYKKEKEELLARFNFERDQQLSKVDIDTFKTLIPSSNLWNGDKIKEIIDSKVSSVYNKADQQSLLPANIVIEGFDQHSKWFLTSAITSVALTSSLPFQSVKTHGLIFDQDGIKMSKSRGNFVDPTDIIEGTQKLSGERDFGFGADVLRLWATINDTDRIFTIDNSILMDINKELKQFRQFSKILLGYLNDYNPQSPVDVEQLSLVDNYTMLRLHETILDVTSAYENTDFNSVYKQILGFM